jgi:EmrB/QacA subfamily drug resistance transporter
MPNKALKTKVLIIATCASFMTPFMGSAVYVALPTIGKDLGADAVQISWISLAYLLAAAMFLVPFGRISDIYGRKKIFTCGMALFVVTALLSSIAPSIYFLIAVRALEGIGGAMIFGTGVAMLSSVFIEDRGKALGINVASVYTGLTLGPFVGGIITQQFGWRVLFLSIIPLGLWVVILATRLKQEWAEAEGETFDFAGSVFYCISLLLIMVALSFLPSLKGFAILGFGAIGIIYFIRYEFKIESPVLDMGLFKNKGFALSSLSALIMYCATFAVGFLLSLYLQYIKGLSPQKAGTVLIAQPIMMALFSPLFGRLSDKIEPRILATTGLILSNVGLVIFAFLNHDTTIPYLILGLLFIGFGFAVFSSPNMNAIMSSVENKYLGVAGSTLATVRLLGQMFSMGTAMLVFNLIIGRVEIIPKYYPLFLRSVKLAFIIFSILCFVGIFVSLSRGKIRS